MSDLLEKPTVIDPREAFDETMRVFGINASELSNLAGISTEQISRYRRQHKDMNSLSLFRVIDSLPNEAKIYFYHLLLLGRQASIAPKKKILKAAEKPAKYSS
jgi:hypothetical protein